MHVEERGVPYSSVILVLHTESMARAAAEGSWGRLQEACPGAMKSNTMDGVDDECGWLQVLTKARLGWA